MAAAQHFTPLAAGVRRRRFALVSATGLAVLGASLGVSFLGDSGSTEVEVTAASSSFVFPVASDNALPLLGLGSGTPVTYTTALKHTTSTGILNTGIKFAASGVAVPTWSPTAGSAGTVTTAGDLAVFDATSATLGDHTTLRVNMYVTNLAELQEAYSSFALPINVWKCASACDDPTDWTQATSVLTEVTYLTNTDGFLSFSLPEGFYYDLTMETGGSFYTISTATPANLNPDFFFTALPI